MKAHLIENHSFRVKIVPEQGGRIESLVHIQSGKDWVWHPEGYEPSSRRLPMGASFDDNWQGGWEEVFPNDSAGEFDGYSLVDHGELWSQPWETIEKDSSGIKLLYRCQRVPVDVEKTIVLSDGAPSLRLHYLFRSRAEKPIPFLFKLHPAIATEPGDQVLLPECKTERVSPDFSYSTQLSEGWAGLLNHRTQTELKFRFDQRDIPYVWIFQNFGKWRSRSTLMLEPSSQMPCDITEAMQRKTCAILEPGKKKEYHFEVMVAPAQIIK